MDPMTPLPPAYDFPNQQPRRDYRLTITLIILLTIGIGFIFAMVVYRTTKANLTESEACADVFLSDLENHQYLAAHKLFSNSVQKHTTPSAVMAYQQRVEASLGGLKSHTMTNWFSGTNNGTTYTTLTYAEKCQKGNASVQLVLDYEADGWHVWEYSFTL
jgi:hypothetical protein